ncbi:MAG: hypothetical protein LQ350_001932 [Teloschistes chrysophthalmus]|nr:MAG: hypothetical protein LQ350_001932 [Niorma chrysophthalma]
MLDENLPTFYLSPSSDNIKHHASVLLSHYGSEAAPAYSLRHPDPALPGSRNRYAVALYDSYHPDILYGEVLLIPEWTQPSLSQEEIRKNGGVPPPPQPILPPSFIIQLYNPDQQILVTQGVSKWSATPQWVFEMPQRSFRQPSVSSIDRTQSDPTASETTPKLRFKWKKDGKLSKDYVCSLSGKNTNPDGSKRKNQEPDITLSIFKHLKEITLYEPNLSRVEMEDPKGLEIVMLLSAIVIREVYNGHLRETFNVADVPWRLSNEAAASRKNSSDRTNRQHNNNSFCQATSTPPPLPTSQRPPIFHSPPPTNNNNNNNNNNNHHKPNSSNPRPPPTDPRSQWEIDAETAVLKKQVEREERERRRSEHAETKRVKKMLEEEERRARVKQAEIDRETERLKREYERERKEMKKQMQGASRPPPPSPMGRPNPSTLQIPGSFTSYTQPPVQRPHSTSPYYPNSGGSGGGPYMYGANNVSSVAFNRQQRPPNSKPGGFFHLFGGSSTAGAGAPGQSGHQRLSKKASAVF